MKVYFDPLVSLAIRCRITPNILTVAAFVASAVAGVLFYLRLDLWAVLAVALNAFFDAMDGAVAREMKITSKRGDFLDHAVDRYADIFIITGIRKRSRAMADRCAGSYRCPHVIVPWHTGTGGWCRQVLRGILAG